MLTNTVVKRVLFDVGKTEVKAIGAELASGQIIKAPREVILCCGALRTPQILMLSGVGPTEELQKHKIQQLASSPDVCFNMHEHLSITQLYKVKNAEKGLCAPSPLFNNPSYLEGIPIPYMIAESASTDLVKAALETDGEVV